MSINAATKSRKKPVTPEPVSRRSRTMTTDEARVKLWIRGNHGVLSRVAAEFERSVQFVQRIAYNREAQSKEFRIERRLAALGCPLMQDFPGKKKK